MKLKAVFSLLIFIVILKCSAQTALDTDGLTNLNNVYLYSLKEYCDSQDSSTTNIIYVKRDYFIGESWPKKINSFEIKYLESNEYKKIIQENNGKITLVGISPLEFRNSNFYVAVIPFSATYKKEMMYLSNGGGLTVNFQFDAEKRGFVFKSKKWRGI
jgi:hypothetical protein